MPMVAAIANFTRVAGSGTARGVNLDDMTVDGSAQVQARLDGRFGVVLQSQSLQGGKPIAPVICGRQRGRHGTLLARKWWWIRHECREPAGFPEDKTEGWFEDSEKRQAFGIPHDPGGCGKAKPSFRNVRAVPEFHAPVCDFPPVCCP